MLTNVYTLEQIFQALLYIGGILSLFFLSLVLFKVYQILKDVRKISHSTGDITSRVHSIVTGPIDMLLSIVGKLTPIIEKSIRDYIHKARNKSSSDSDTDSKSASKSSKKKLKN